MEQEITYQYNSQYQEQPPPPPPPRPVRDRRINYGVVWIILTCVVMFALQIMDRTGLEILWMWPNENLEAWQFVTSAFLHGGISHIFWNMFMLYMFGMALENLIGTKRFVALFLIAGIIGNIGYVLFCIATGSDTPAVGASGALYGVFACLAILLPNMRVYFFFAIPMKMIHALLFYAAIDIVFIGANDSIAHAAHIAGLVAGLAFGLYLRKKLPVRPPVVNRYQNAPYR